MQIYGSITSIYFIIATVCGAAETGPFFMEGSENLKVLEVRANVSLL